MMVLARRWTHQNSGKDSRVVPLVAVQPSDVTVAVTQKTHKN